MLKNTKKLFKLIEEKNALHKKMFRWIATFR